MSKNDRYSICVEIRTHYDSDIRPLPWPLDHGYRFVWQLTKIVKWWLLSAIIAEERLQLSLCDQTKIVDRLNCRTTSRRRSTARSSAALRPSCTSSTSSRAWPRHSSPPRTTTTSGRPTTSRGTLTRDSECSARWSTSPKSFTTSPSKIHNHHHQQQQ